MTSSAAAIDPAAQTARRSLRLFDIEDGARIEFVNRRENIVFRVTSDGNDWALKLHRPGYHTDSEIESESALLETLTGAGVSVPTPVRRSDDSHVAHVADADGNSTQVTMQRWLASAIPLGSSPLTFTGQARPTDAQLLQFGRTIALLHRCWERTGTPAGYDRLAWDAAGLSGPDALWGRASRLNGLTPEQRVTFEEAEQRLAQDLAVLPRTPSTYGPIHGDLTLENILDSERGLSVIDFDDCGEGWYLFDLATACFFLTGHGEADEMVGAVLRGYQSERSLSVADRQAWHPLLLARALSYLAWSVARPEVEATQFHLDSVLPHAFRASLLYLSTGHTGWTDLPMN
ncbi:phosphotransferase enzyme family protein [Leifsonia shinshuensis]|uniref:Phosphotransferase n=1 Tax=Leifsonia shinshuensis TaxID=150026 RepID=A0A7G6YA83_9MICO|nr:phosphotransferase [Leifsonia shinshuensis]QNE35398.1 phosphotransferase [Leifsonia shinshuensis]